MASLYTLARTHQFSKYLASFLYLAQQKNDIDDSNKKRYKSYDTLVLYTVHLPFFNTKDPERNSDK